MWPAQRRDPHRAAGASALAHEHRAAGRGPDGVDETFTAVHDPSRPYDTLRGLTVDHCAGADHRFATGELEVRPEVGPRCSAVGEPGVDRHHVQGPGSVVRLEAPGPEPAGRIGQLGDDPAGEEEAGEPRAGPEPLPHDEHPQALAVPTVEQQVQRRVGPGVGVDHEHRPGSHPVPECRDGSSGPERPLRLDDRLQRDRADSTHPGDVVDEEVGVMVGVHDDALDRRGEIAETGEGVVEKWPVPEGTQRLGEVEGERLQPGAEPGGEHHPDEAGGDRGRSDGAGGAHGARLSPVQTRRFVNPSQPQTLYIATFLLYFNAVFGLLFVSSPLFFFGIVPGLALTVGMAAGAYGIANEKRWGYWLGVGISGLALVPFAVYIVSNGIGSLFQIALLISLVFPVALFVLLVHPMSRQYQRIWFS